MNRYSDVTQPNDPQQSSDFEYTKVDGEVTIIKLKNKKMTGAVVISRMIDGLPVTSIGERAFSGCENLASITIPGSVTSIRAYAFAKSFWDFGNDNLTIHVPRGSEAETYAEEEEIEFEATD